MSRLRDAKGRFMKRPKAAAIDPELMAQVKAMAAERPVIDDWSTQKIELVIASRSYDGKSSTPWKVTRGGVNDDRCPGVT